MSPFRDDCLDDDARDRPEPEAPARCFECKRLSADVDRCPHCGSPLMVSEETIAIMAANRAHRPRPKQRKKR
jgi:hypothetical protein